MKTNRKLRTYIPYVVCVLIGKRRMSVLFSIVPVLKALLLTPLFF